MIFGLHVSASIPAGKVGIVSGYALANVGSIHGGSKHNIISNEVKLQLTLRSYNPEVRLLQIAVIKRLTNGIVMSTGLSDDLMPLIILLLSALEYGP